MDVGAWLRGLGLGQYEGAFRDNDVDAGVLPTLTADDLRELGVAQVFTPGATMADIVSWVRANVRSGTAAV